MRANISPSVGRPKKKWRVSIVDRREREREREREPVS